MTDPADDGSALQRAIAERAREFAMDSTRPRPRRHWQHAITLIAALLVVALVFLGFDTFLTSMQKLLAIMAADPAPTGPVPVFMVPEPPHPP
jgi:ferric-dicitrate binding protein FerR (iron transport regulator)